MCSKQIDRTDSIGVHSRTACHTPTYTIWIIIVKGKYCYRRLINCCSGSSTILFNHTTGSNINKNIFLAIAARKCFNFFLEIDCFYINKIMGTVVLTKSVLCKQTNLKSIKILVQLIKCEISLLHLKQIGS